MTCCAGMPAACRWTGPGLLGGTPATGPDGNALCASSAIVVWRVVVGQCVAPSGWLCVRASAAGSVACRCGRRPSDGTNSSKFQAMIRSGSKAESFAAESFEQRRVEDHDLGLPANFDAPPGLTDRSGVSAWSSITRETRGSAWMLRNFWLLAGAGPPMSMVPAAPFSQRATGWTCGARPARWLPGAPAVPGQVHVLGLSKDHAASMQPQPSLRSSPSRPGAALADRFPRITLGAPRQNRMGGCQRSR
jgi:hypothetical protein